MGQITDLKIYRFLQHARQVASPNLGSQNVDRLSPQVSHFVECSPHKSIIVEMPVVLLQFINRHAIGTVLSILDRGPFLVIVRRLPSICMNTQDAHRYLSIIY